MRTVVVCLVLGTLITLFASLRPALRATRVAPIAAVREGAVLPPGRLARFSPIISAVVLALGILLLVYGVLAHGLETKTRLFSLGAGILLLFFGVSANAAKVVRPLASVLGWPATKFGGTAGVLARDNSKRNPKRTASTASALMIGLALVTFVAILGQGIRSSFESAVDQLFKGDYALTSTNTFIPLTTAAEAAVAKAPNITAVSGIRAGSARYFGNVDNLTAVDPSLPKVVNPRLEGRVGQRYPRSSAKTVRSSTTSSPRSTTFTSAPSSQLQTPDRKFLPPAHQRHLQAAQGRLAVRPRDDLDRALRLELHRPQNEMVFINTKGGVSDANTKTLDDSVSSFADAKIQTASEFKTNFEKPLNNIIRLLYVLLALSVIVSLFGIVNTLILSIYERTRELGMLRAVGMTRWQIRSMIGYESSRHVVDRRSARNGRGHLPRGARDPRTLERGCGVRGAVAVDRLLRDRRDRSRHPSRRSSRRGAPRASTCSKRCSTNS
jgi:putative ABC transport system permease protein